MILNNTGKMVENEWLRLSDRSENICFHEYTVMKNYFHAILEIIRTTAVGATSVGATLVVVLIVVVPELFQKFEMRNFGLN